MNVTVTTPPGFEPSGLVLAEAAEIGRATGATVRVAHDAAEGAKGADVLYTDVWASMGQEADAEARKAKFQGFQINAGLLSHAKKDAVILHCLPAHYGEEIDYAASRTPNSAIFDQAENRMHAQNALLVLVAGAAGKPSPKPSATRATRPKARPASGRARSHR